MPLKSSDRTTGVGVGWKQWPPDRVGCCILIAALWLTTRPYQGIVHDAQLYAVNALAALNPGPFAGDLHLRFGTQERFTLLSPVYSLAVSLLGAGSAHLLLTLAGQILWLGALVLLVRSLCRDAPQLLLGIALSIALPGGYGGLRALNYGEPFLTPRLYAEALTMIGLAHVLRRRAAWSVLALSAALVVHPLVALPGLAMAGLYAVWSDWRWIWLVLVIVIGSAVPVLLGLHPFPALLATYDAEWLRIIEHRDALAFVTRWSFHDFAQLGATVALAGICLALAEPAMRRFLAIALAVGLGGLTVALIAGDGAKSLLVVFLQPWRAQWVLVLAANIGAGAVSARFLEARDDLPPSRIIAAIGIAVLVAARASQGFYSVAAVVFLLGLLAIAWEAGAGRRLPRWAEAPMVVLCVVVAGGPAAFFLFFLQRTSGIWAHLYELLFVTTAIGIAAALLAGPLARMEARPLLILSIVMLMLSAILWDRRSPLQRFLESGDPAPPGLAALLPDKASVYWERGYPLLWLKLGRASFFSCAQGANSGFFRDNAIAYDHRERSLAPLQTGDYENLPGGMCPDKAATDEPRPTRNTVAQACRREPGLDYIVLTNPIDRAFFAEWRSPEPMLMPRVVTNGGGHYTFENVDRFYFYRCADLRGD
jgi:hypothetical protein